MSKKMWNKIFKNKPIKPAVSAVKSPSNENNRYSYYEEFYNTCTVPPFKESSNSTSGKSKFSLVVNSFSLKRNSKENNNSRKNNTNNNKNKSVFNKQSNDDDGDFKTPMDLTPTDAIDSVSSTKVSTEPNINIPEEPEKLELHPCRICNRTFVPRTLAKHVVICEKTAIKKRKQFDSLRQRTEGTELADYVPKKFGLPITTFPERSISPKPKLTVPVVKAEPEKILIKKPEVVTEPEVEPITETIERKTAPVAKGTLNRQKANTPIRESIRKRNLVPDSTQCPHCSRFFGVKAYERHYIWCKEKSLDIATKNLGVTQAAKERLEARVNYRAPNLKTKRAVNREKYSGINDDDVSLKNSKLMCTSLGSSFMSDGVKCKVESPKKSPKKLRKSMNHSSITLPQLKNLKATNKDQAEKISSHSLKHQTKSKKISTNKNKKNHNQTLNKITSDEHIELFIANSQLEDENIEEELLTNRTETFMRAGISDRELEDIFEREFASNKGNLSKFLNTSKTKKKSVHNNLKIVQGEEGKGISDNMSHCSLKSKSSEDSFFSSNEVGLSRSHTTFYLSTDDDRKSRGSIKYFDCPDDNISKNSLRGLSDKYDPFQSAKRQLEELCSPPSPEQHQKFVHSPNTKTFTRSKLSPGKFTTPYNSINSSPSTNPKVALSAIKSNFRRTSSLRSPRKAAFLASRPIYQPNTLRPTIQRGLSDEGPISSNFLKPEEYDEMPVRSVCSNDFAITNSPRVIRRDSSASNRRILGLNLPKENSPTTMQNNKISKTDSLAIFLKYENDAKTIDSPVTTKDLKDKSNTLSKQNSAKNITNEIEEKTFIEENDVNSTKSTLLLQPQPSPQPKRYDTCMTVNKINSIRLDPLPTKFLVNHSTPKQQSPKQIQTSETLNSSTFSNSVNLNSIFDTKHISDDFIDPKLINDIDNLPINVTKQSSDSDLTSNVSSDTGNHQKLTVSDTQSQYNDSQSPPIQDYQHQYQQQNEQQQKQIQQPNAPIPNKPLTDTSSNRNSTDNRNLLKRKMRVGRNQFLYDASPESDLDNESNNSLDDEQNRTLNTLSMNDKKQTSPPTIPPFDEFDFEEFLSSFENDTEQFPLFKDCREFLMSRTHNKQQQSSSSDKNNKIDIDSICSDLPYNNKNININNNNNNNNNNVENDNDNVKNNNYTMLFDRSSPIHVTENNKLSDNEEDEEDKRHEIFISIETDQNDNDSINSSHCNSLSGKQIALVEEIDANDNKFTKIIDDGTSGDYNKNSKKIRKLPDVKRNNAKNLLLHDYHQSNEKIVKHESIENIHSSHHSIESKSSNASKKRPSTSATPEMLRYQQSFVKHPPTHKQPTLIRRSASSSSSENSLPPINSTTNMDILMKSLTVSSFKDSKRCEKNSNRSVSPTISTKTLTPNMANINTKKNKLPVTTSSKTSCNSSKNGRISKFCHECGSKFMLETAKFCMDCGVKRIIV